MTVLNELDRFHLVISAIDRLPECERGIALQSRLRETLREHHRYIREHGEDLPEIRNWRWTPRT
jgi:xylulose-5-phosphate/fructose-6-phosphate phosphoketolase